MEGLPPSDARPASWRAVLWLGLRPANPLEPSRRSPYHPFSLALRVVIVMVVMMVATLPFYPSISLSKKLSTTENEGQAIATALSYDSVRGRQREFLSQFEMGLAIAERRPRSGKIPLPVSIVAPDRVQEALEEKINDHAPALAQPDCTGCVRLEWVSLVGWNYKVMPQVSSETVESFLGDISIQELESRLGWFIREGLSELPGPPEILLDPDQAFDALVGGIALSVRFGAHLTLCLVFLMFPLVAGGTVGLNWERNRANAALEPWVFAYHPPWVAYLGEIIREGRFVLVVMLAALSLVWLYGVPVHWPFLLSMFPLGISLFVLSSMWGLLATVLFHHPRGRMFSKVALSPMTIGGVWVIRILILWAAMKAFQPVSFIEQAEELLQNYHVLLLAIPPMLLITWGLAILTNKRIGPRREGLRETKFQ